jgi:uncharacterized membrane protein
MIAAILFGCAQDVAVDTGFCAEAPIATYSSFGAAFLQENCQSCHASTAPNRNGAPENMHFDDELQASEHYAQILSSAGSETPSMPPRGGVSDEDRSMLQYWLICGEGL